MSCVLFSEREKQLFRHYLLFINVFSISSAYVLATTPVVGYKNSSPARASWSIVCAADLRFCGRQHGTSRSCKTMDTGLVCCTVFLFTASPPPSPYTGTKLYCQMTERQMCVKQLVEGDTRQCSGWNWTRDLQSQVQRHNHYATKSHHTVKTSSICRTSETLMSIYLYWIVLCYAPMILFSWQRLTLSYRLHWRTQTGDKESYCIFRFFL